MNSDQELKTRIFLKIIKNIPLESSDTDTIKEIKTKVYMTEGISVNKQELIFGGNHLKDEQTLAECNIPMNSTINLYVVDGMNIIVKIPPTGKSVMLQVKRCNTIQTVKAMVEEKEGIPATRQSIIYLGKLIEDNNTLVAHGIRDNSILNIALQPIEKLQLYVCMPSGKSILLEVRTWFTIGDIKMMVESMEGLPMHRQKLVFNEKELEDSLTLQEQDITDKSLLHLHPPSMQIFVKISNGRTLTLWVEKVESIGMLMEKIEKRLGFEIEHKHMLSYSGKILRPENTIGFYGIQDESTIHLNPRVSHAGVQSVTAQQ